MSGEKLLRAIGLVEDDLILEADQTPAPRKEKTTLRRWLPLAACAALACLLPLLLRAGDRYASAAPGTAGAEALDETAQQNMQDAGGGAAPQAFALGESGGGGFGFEGLLEFAPSELERGCPWQPGDAVDSLPVYKNGSTLYLSGAARFTLDAQQMEARLRELAAKLGYAVEEVEISPTESEIAEIWEKLQGADSLTVELNTRPYRAAAECGGAVLAVDAGGDLTVEFREPIALPAGYDFTADAGAAEAGRTALYLWSVYGEPLGLSQPMPRLFQDYTYEGEAHREFAVFEGSGTLADQLLQFSLGGLTFWNDEQGRLYGFRLSGAGAAGEKLGDYPVVSYKDAQTLLAQGVCLTSVTEAFPGMEYLAAAELVYRVGSDTVAPYYRFLVELPSLERENGLKTYGAYYVPAVESAYITDMPSAQWQDAAPSLPPQ
ncbi:hypothetical protein H8S23_02680 [Anaerofilum sp. BX8]|uniref:Uncharacterized protein n=1 Tax=Anaerofilum hominis TaxID=2763016 RepID=A0A923L0Z9_9FIRM|nr:hypothetical protein [Anaerofilum hominis]MBC5580403.1 hypothetical protein [Anaerofilum hominis]